MIVKFEGKTLEVFSHSVSVSYIRTGDFITYHGELCKVVTVQRNCEPITSRARQFTMVTLTDRDGNIYPVRDFHGKISIFRGRIVSKSK